MLWRSGGSSLMKSNHWCVATPKLMEVHALFCEMSMDRTGPPSMRENASRLPDSSQTAMHILRLISIALASAAAIIFFAASADSDCLVMILDINYFLP